MKSLIKVRQISKSYDTQTGAVDNVTFDIQEGEVVSILGESGSGKSTLLRLLAGLEDATTGNIEVAEEAITGPDHNLVPGYDSIALVDQGFKLERFKTIKDNIASVIYYFAPDDRYKRVNELIELCLLDDKADSFPHELSGGQQQRVAIAIALAKEPEVVLMDEPFSNLDSRLKSIIREEVIDILRTSGVTVVMVSHDHADAMSVADRIMIMHNGNIIQSGSPEELYKKPINEYAANFLGPSNQLKLNGFRKLSIIRPERISIRKNGQYEGEVTKTVFHGLHHHVFVKSKISTADILIYSKTRKNKGLHIRFDVN